MKKSRGFINYNCDDDNAEQVELYRNENLSQEDTIHKAKRTGRKDSRLKAAARRRILKSVRKTNRDESFED